MVDPGQVGVRDGSEVRAAEIGDARRLAELMDIAGEGIPMYLWPESAGRDGDPLEFGAGAVSGTEGGFSYVNAHVAEIGDEVVGMLLGYRLPDPHDVEPLSEAPAVVRPLLELEALAPGSWYVNAVAADPAWRGRGVGSALMQRAEEAAAGSGADSLSLIVAEENRGARWLYDRLGFADLARRPLLPWSGCRHSGDWVLMTKPVPGLPGA